MKITLADVENALNQGLNLVTQLAPLASLGGPAAASIAGIVGQVTSFAEQVIPQIEGDAAIIAGGDLTAIKALQAKLQAANAALADQIANS